MEIALRLDELIKERSTHELTPEEVELLQREYLDVHMRGLEGFRGSNEEKNDAPEMEHEVIISKNNGDVKKSNKEKKTKYSLFE